MLLSTILPLLPFILAQARAQQPHPYQLQQEERQLDERGMPITATTTMWHMVTMTETVWVQPTDQAVFAPMPPSHTADHSSSSSHTSSSASPTVHVDSVTSHSPSPTASSASSSASSHITTHASSDAVTSTSSHTTSPTSTEQRVVVESAGASPHSPSHSSSTHSDTTSSSAAAHISHTSSHTSSHTISSAVSPTVTPSYVPYSRSSGSGDAQVAPSSSHTTTSTPIAASSSPQSSSSHSSSSHTAGSVTVDAASSKSSAHSSSASHTTESSLTIEADSSSSSSHTTSSTISVVSTVSPSPSPSPSPSSSSSASPSPSPSAASGLPPVPSRILAGYYPDWSSWYLAPEKVDFSKFDILDFAFAIPTESGGLEFTQNDSSDLLHRLVKVAHAHGKRVKLSVGGWTGSKFFSPISADAGLRKVFVKSMTDAYHTYNLDGIDIDWEYPGAGGASGNIVSPQDSANYLIMLQDLRAALPDGALITLATQVWPFTGSNGSPLSNVKGFAAVIDWILIMNYDIWGSSSTPGPNAPLSDACRNSTQPLANAYASVSSWTQAGLDPSQITIGVPAYGYLQQSWATSLRQRDVPDAPANSTMWPMRERRGMEKRFTTVSSGWSTTEGQVMWHDLVSQGALQKQWDGQWVGAGGFSRIWDECSSTPFLKSTQSGQIVTYDDPQSMSLKGQFAAQAGLRGCNVFSVDGDLTNGEWPLTDAVRSGLGLK